MLTIIIPSVSRTFLVIISLLALVACGSNKEPTQLPDDSFIKGVNFVGVSVSDLERSVDLYTSAVDLKPVGDEQTVSSEGKTAQARLLRGANAQLLFMQFNDIGPFTPVPVNGPGIAHVCYQVDAKTRAYQNLLTAGASAIGDADMVQLNPRNPVDYAYLHDPDQIMLEVEHVHVDKLDLSTPPKNQYRLRHVSLGTPDMGRALDFYKTLLGQNEPRRIGRWWKLSGEKLDRVSGLPGSKIEMAWFQIRNLELELIQYHSHTPGRSSEPRGINALGYNMIVFEVDSLERARSEVSAAGGKLLPNSWPLLGIETLFARDPDGNLLGFQVTERDHPLSSQHFVDNGL